MLIYLGNLTALYWLAKNTPQSIWLWFKASGGYAHIVVRMASAVWLCRKAQRCYTEGMRISDARRGFR